MSNYAPGKKLSDLSLAEVPTLAVDTPSAEATPSLPIANAENAVHAASTDPFLAQAIKELESGHVEQALWEWASNRAGADAALAKPAYLRARAAALRVARRDKAAERQALRPSASRVAESGYPLTQSPQPPAAKDAADAIGRGGATPKRKRLILAAGAVGSLVVGAALVGLWWQGNSTAQANAARPVVQTSKSGISTPSDGEKHSLVTASGAEPPTLPREDFARRVQELKSTASWNVLVLYAVEWTRKQPGNPEAWRELSAGYVQLRQFGDALDAATKVAQLAPRDSLAWQNLGQLNSVLQRPGPALVAFEQATALNDQDMTSLVQAGILNAQLGRLPEARIAFTKALTASPGLVDAICGAASTAQKEGRSKDAEVLTRELRALDAVCRDSGPVESVRVVVAAPAKKKIVPSTGR